MGTSTVDSKLPSTWSNNYHLSDDGKTLTVDTPYSMKGQIKIIFKRKKSKIKKEKLVFAQNGDDIKTSCHTYGNGYKEDTCAYKVGTRFTYHNKFTKTDHEAIPRLDGNKLVLECKDLGQDMKYTLIYEVSEDGGTLSI